MAAILAVAGCSAPSGGTTPTTSAASPAATSPAETPAVTAQTTTQPTTAAPALPDGYTMVTTTQNQLKLALPSSLTLIDPSNLKSDLTEQQLVPDMAQRLGITVDQMNQQLDGLDLFAMDDFGNNINLVPPVAGIGAKESNIAPGLENVGAVGITSRTSTSQLGPVLILSYQIALADGTSTPQSQIYAQSSASTTAVVTITGLTWTPDQISQMADVIVASLEKA